MRMPPILIARLYAISVYLISEVNGSDRQGTGHE